MPVKTPTPGRPRMTSSEANVRRVRDILEVNPRMSVREIVDNLSLPRSTVHRILKVHLKFRNVYSVWVPHVLSDDNKRQRIQCCKDIVKLFRTNARSFLGSHYLVQDESWIPWDFEDNRRVWIATTAVKPTTPRPKLTPRKTMVIVAYTSQPKRFSLTLLPQGATVNSGITKKFLDDTQRRFRQLQGAPIQLADMVLQWDNASSHTSRETTAHLAKLKVQLVKQSPYSPDLNMCDRFLFRKIKSGMKLSSFNGPEDVETAVRRAFDRIPESELMRELEKLKTHCDGVIEQSGAYLSDV